MKFLKVHGLLDKTNLLIIDGHKSHLYYHSFYEAIRANNIEIITIPPHISHILQALDSVPFTQFKKSWESNLKKYITNHSGRVLNKVNSTMFLSQPGILQSLLSILSQVLRKQGYIPIILRSSLQNPWHLAW